MAEGKLPGLGVRGQSWREASLGPAAGQKLRSQVSNTSRITGVEPPVWSQHDLLSKTDSLSKNHWGFSW